MQGGGGALLDLWRPTQRVSVEGGPALWLCWVGSICWEKNWLRVSFNCHKQLQVKSEAELRSVQNTLNLLNQSLSPTFSRKLGNMKSSEHLVEQLFRLREQRIMGNIQWDDSVRVNTLRHFDWTENLFIRHGAQQSDSPHLAAGGAVDH